MLHPVPVVMYLRPLQAEFLWENLQSDFDDVEMVMREKSTHPSLSEHGTLTNLDTLERYYGTLVWGKYARQEEPTP
jgi:hypothetical protein